MEANELLNEIDEKMRTMPVNEVIDWLGNLAIAADSEGQDSRFLIAAYNELGTLCRGNERLEEAEKAFSRAIEIVEAPFYYASFGCSSCSDDEEEILPAQIPQVYIAEYATLLNNLAGTYRLQGRLDDALDAFEKAKVVYAEDEATPADLKASCYNNMGLVYLDMKKYSEAKKEFLEAEKIIDDIPENIVVHMVTDANLAYAEYGLGNYAEAARLMSGAKEAAADIGDKNAEEYYAKLTDMFLELAGKLK